MNNKLKKSIGLTFVFLFIFVIMGTKSINALAATITKQTRYSGNNRIETAVAISKAGWTSSSNVVLAYSMNFPDALSGVPFAYLKDAPILLTDKSLIPEPTINEIKRLGATNVYILGSNGLINDAVENRLINEGYNVVRIGGTDRFETSMKIADEVNKTNTLKTAIITIYNNYPDALAIAPYAAIKSMPILYTEGNSLNYRTKNWLKSNGITKVIISGGVGAISLNVENQLKNEGLIVQRAGGANRYQTALSVVKTFNDTFNNDVMLTVGSDFPDALAGGVLAAKTKTPILLAERTVMDKEVESFISSKANLNVVVLGSNGVIQDNVSNYFRKLVVVDPGHDYGGDYGAVGNGYSETDLNMQVAVRVKTSLEARGYKVLLTRQAWERPTSSSSKESLLMRSNFANSQKADLFISIHHDKSSNTNTTGISTHYSTYRPNIDTSGIITGNDPNGWYSGVNIDTTPSSAAVISRTLSDKIAADLASKMGYVNKRSHDHNLSVTSKTNMPSVLIECGFLSNLNEARRSANAENQKILGETIAETIKQTFK